MRHLCLALLCYVLGAFSGWRDVTPPAPAPVPMPPVYETVPLTAPTPPAIPQSAVSALRRVRPSVALLRVTLPGSGGQTRQSVASAVSVGGGRLVTCDHVVSGALGLTAELPGDPVRYPVTVLRRRPDLDLALLQIAARPPAAELAGAVPELGADVLAVGNPYGYSWTATRGIVSAHGRAITLPSGVKLGGLLQTDAAINPGNSGGPLVNLRGEVTGVVCALRDDAHGLAFIVPIGSVRQLLAPRPSSR